MVIGQKKSYDFRFGDEFSNFLQSIDRASVTYKINPVEVNGKLDETPDVRFNLQPTVNKYTAILANEFSNSCDDIERMMDDVYSKSEKLNLLSRFIVEIEACQRLLVHTSEGYNHKRFSFSNISKDEEYQAVEMKEKDFQEYFFWMDHYLQKMHAFLLYLKSSTEIISQTEFRIPTSMLPDVNASTAEKPFAFFEYLFQRNGIAQLRRAFIPSEEDYDYYPDMHYDAENEIITTYQQDQETGEWEEYKKSFKDNLFDRLYKEYLNSRQLFDEHIDSLKTEGKIKLFVTLSLGNIKYLLTTLNRNADARMYEFSPRPLRAIIRYLYERYEAFCPQQDELVMEILAKGNQPQIQQETQLKTLPLAQRGVQTFKCLKKSVEDFTVVLHQHLTTGAFIDKDTDIEILRNAFRFGISIKELFYTAMNELPKRVVIHKRTYFTSSEINGLRDSLISSGVQDLDLLEISFVDDIRFLATKLQDGMPISDNFAVPRGTCILLDNNSILLWTHGIVSSVRNPNFKYYLGGRYIPCPLKITKHLGNSNVGTIANEVLGLTKMNWNSFDLYSQLPATLNSSNEIARIGRLLLKREGVTYDYRYFI